MKLAPKIIAALAIGAASLSVAHAGWERIDDTHYWNTDRVQISGNDRTVFIKQTKSGKSPSGVQYASSIVLPTINCQTLSMRINSAEYYDSQGKSVDFMKIPRYLQDEEPTYPDSTAERIARAVCARLGGKAATGARPRSELDRLHAQADGSVPSGKALPGYADRVRRRVQPNIVATGDIAGNPTAVVTMQLAPDGSLLSVRLAKSSGDAGWDSAVLRAVERSDPLPRDENGKAPSTLTITFRPKE